jgi:hypothetical protein
MLQPTLITWILVIFGAVFIFLLLLYAQLLMALRPRSQATKDIIIGKGEDWRNETHFQMSYGTAWADLLVWFPLLVARSVGVLLGQTWRAGDPGRLECSLRDLWESLFCALTLQRMGKSTHALHPAHSSISGFAMVYHGRQSPGDLAE